LELLADPQAQQRIAAGEADFDRGDVLDEQQLRALIAKRHRTQPE
jgi:predicted transcriptional regulator